MKVCHNLFFQWPNITIYIFNTYYVLVIWSKLFFLLTFYYINGFVFISILLNSTKYFINLFSLTISLWMIRGNFLMCLLNDFPFISKSDIKNIWPLINHQCLWTLKINDNVFEQNIGIISFFLYPLYYCISLPITIKICYFGSFPNLYDN